MLFVIRCTKNYCATLLLATAAALSEASELIVLNIPSLSDLGIFIPEILVKETRLHEAEALPLLRPHKTEHGTAIQTGDQFKTGFINSQHSALSSWRTQNPGRHHQIDHRLFNVSRSSIEQTGEEMIRFLPEYAGCDSGQKEAGTITAYNQWLTMACDPGDPAVMLCKPGERNHQCRMAADSVIYSPESAHPPTAPPATSDQKTTSDNLPAPLSKLSEPYDTSPLFQTSCLFMLFSQRQFILTHTLLLSDGKTVSLIQCQSAAHEYGQRHIVTLDFSQPDDKFAMTSQLDGKAVESVLVTCPANRNCQLTDDGGGNGSDDEDGGGSGNEDNGHEENPDQQGQPEGNNDPADQEGSPPPSEAGEGSGGDDGDDDRDPQNNGQGAEEEAFYEEPPEEDQEDEAKPALPAFLQYLKNLSEGERSDEERQATADLLKALIDELKRLNPDSVLADDLQQIADTWEFEGINWSELSAAFSSITAERISHLDDLAHATHRRLYPEDNDIDDDDDDDDGWDGHFGQESSDEEVPPEADNVPEKGNDPDSSSTSGSLKHGSSTWSLASAGASVSELWKKGRSQGKRLRKAAKRRCANILKRAKGKPENKAPAASEASSESTETSLTRRGIRSAARTLLPAESSSKLLQLLGIETDTDTTTPRREISQEDPAPPTQPESSQYDPNAGLLNLLDSLPTGTASNTNNQASANVYDTVAFEPPETAPPPVATTSGNIPAPEAPAAPLSVDHAQEVPMLITAEVEASNEPALPFPDHTYATVSRQGSSDQAAAITRRRRPPPPPPGAAQSTVAQPEASQDSIVSSQQGSITTHQEGMGDEIVVPRSTPQNLDSSTSAEGGTEGDTGTDSPAEVPTDPLQSVADSSERPQAIFNAPPPPPPPSEEVMADLLRQENQASVEVEVLQPESPDIQINHSPSSSTEELDSSTTSPTAGTLSVIPEESSRATSEFQDSTEMGNAPLPTEQITSEPAPQLNQVPPVSNGQESNLHHLAVPPEGDLMGFSPPPADQAGSSHPPSSQPPSVSGSPQHNVQGESHLDNSLEVSVEIDEFENAQVNTGNSEPEHFVVDDDTSALLGSELSSPPNSPDSALHSPEPNVDAEIVSSQEPEEIPEDDFDASETRGLLDAQ